MVSNSILTDYQWCIVPECNNTTINTPTKLWIELPKKTRMRNTWLKLARRNPKFFSTQSQLYFCEDHFDLENDMEDYTQYKIADEGTIIQMKPDCVPSRFNFQTNGKCTSAQGEPLTTSKAMEVLQHRKNIAIQAHIRSKKVYSGPKMKKKNMSSPVTETIKQREPTPAFVEPVSSTLTCVTAPQTETLACVTTPQTETLACVTTPQIEISKPTPAFVEPVSSTLTCVTTPQTETLACVTTPQTETSIKQEEDTIEIEPIANNKRTRPNKTVALNIKYLIQKNPVKRRKKGKSILNKITRTKKQCRSVQEALTITQRIINIRRTRCATCFCVDRNLFPINEIPFMNKLVPEVKFTEQDKICWECDAMIKKFKSFKIRVTVTQALFQHAFAGLDVENLKGLTCLKTSKKESIDISPIVKIPEDDIGREHSYVVDNENKPITGSSNYNAPIKVKNVQQLNDEVKRVMDETESYLVKDENECNELNNVETHLDNNDLEIKEELDNIDMGMDIEHSLNQFIITPSNIEADEQFVDKIKHEPDPQLLAEDSVIGRAIFFCHHCDMSFKDAKQYRKHIQYSLKHRKIKEQEKKSFS